jgi:cyclohexadienyl dehydratase
MSSAFEDSSMLRTEGVRVGVNPGGTNEAFVRKSMEGGRGQITILEQGTQAQALLGDTVDVIVTDAIEARLMLQRHPGKLCIPSRSAPNPFLCT